MPPRKQNLENLKREKEAFVLASKLIGDKFLIPTKSQKIRLYDISGIDYKKYSKTIDGIILRNVKDFDSIKTTKDFYFLEIKATKSETVKELPYGVFFGFTENEENLLKTHSNYRLCIIHVILEKHYIMDYNEYASLISRKRTQYQVNFRSNKG